MRVASNRKDIHKQSQGETKRKGRVGFVYTTMPTMTERW